MDGGLLILLAAGAVVALAVGGLLATFYWSERLDDAWQAGHAAGLSDGAAAAECRGHVRTIARPYDHERSGL